VDYTFWESAGQSAELWYDNNMNPAKVLAVVILLSVLAIPALADSPQRLWGTYPASWGAHALPTYPALSKYDPISARASVTPQWIYDIQTRLGYRLTVDFAQVPLSEAARTISQLLGVAVVLSSAARESGKAITLSVPSMRGALVLEWVCRLADADWRIMDEAVYILLKSELPAEEKPPTLEEIIETINKESEPVTDFKPPDDPIYGD